MQTFEINMKLPSLNDYIRVCRGNKYKANEYKAKIEQDIALCLSNMPKWTRPIQIHFHWIESNNKRDLDNICFAKKFILDSMVKYGKLTDDNRKYVYAFKDSFEKGKETKVILEVEEC